MELKQPSEDYMTVKDFMKKYGVSRMTVYNWRKTGKIKSMTFLDRRLVKKE